MINVTKSFLPPFDVYTEYLARIWENNILTNRGPLTLEFEKKISERFDNHNILFVSNGTIALQLLYKLYGLTGEVITTPFSYVATTSSLIWEGLKPVFVDIDHKSFCIDPLQIEAAITEKTTAILATHVFGNPCDVEMIQLIADKHKLKVIYDAAHAFDVSIDGKSVLNFGDASTLSFHATKVFHTGEGGAVALNSSENWEELKLLHSFGHRGDEHFNCGINAKNSEFHAAMGLANYGFIEEIIADRKKISDLYDEYLCNLPLQYQEFRPEVRRNYSYYPIVLQSEDILLQLQRNLKVHNINARRYFYPSLNTLPYVDIGSCPVSENIAGRILCLPLYHGLAPSDVRQISDIVIESCL
jgi:dTDP-4-amino-4,6-dideoxygalactose transaminase